jgi:rhomboid family GlyGly-CTERM serine protease
MKVEGSTGDKGAVTLAAEQSVLRLPVVTTMILALAALVFPSPSLNFWLIYDRQAIGRGEVWRLLSGNFVHLSAMHFILDMLAMGIVGWAIERRAYRGFGWLTLGVATAIGLGLYFFQPGIARYGGLSGLVIGAVVFLGLNGLSEGGVWRCICALLLGGVVTKLAFESLCAEILFVRGYFVACPVSHIIGGSAAVCLWLFQNAGEKLGKDPRSTGSCRPE